MNNDLTIKKMTAQLANSMPSRLPLLDEYKLGWELYGNPLFVWAAIKECEEQGAQYPGWIEKYLTQSAEKLLAKDIVKTGKGAGNIAASNLGFDSRGQGNIFDQFINQKRAVEVFVTVATYQTEHPEINIEPILEEYADQYQLDSKLVRQWVDRISKKIVKKIS